MRAPTCAVLAIAAVSLFACTQDEAGSTPERQTHMGAITAAPVTAEPSTPESIDFPRLPGSPTASAAPSASAVVAGDAAAAPSASAAASASAAPVKPAPLKAAPKH